MYYLQGSFEAENVWGIRVLHKVYTRFRDLCANFLGVDKKFVQLDNMCIFSPQKLAAVHRIKCNWWRNIRRPYRAPYTPGKFWWQASRTHTISLPSPSLQKVDMYSLGIILFEMCHPPCSTSMERHKLLAGVRRKEILFPPGFEAGREKQVRSSTTPPWVVNLAKYYNKGLSSNFFASNRLLEKIVFAMVVCAFTDFDLILAIPTTTHFYPSVTMSTVILKYGSARCITSITDVCMRLW